VATVANRVARADMTSSRAAAAARPAPRWPGILLGVGLGGFVDGIVLHQILQWHHMLTAEGCCPSTTIGGLQDNTLADGFFHVATWIALVVATSTMLRAWQRGRLAPPWLRQIGLAAAGWGLFNLVEGLIDHELLGLHHVRDDIGAPLGWDVGFLAFGAALLAGGLLAARA
jgi:uncharacterized membrane protein